MSFLKYSVDMKYLFFAVVVVNGKKIDFQSPRIKERNLRPVNNSELPFSKETGDLNADV